MKDFIIFKRNIELNARTRRHNIALDAGVKIGYGAIDIPRNVSISDEVKIYNGAIIREGTIVYTGCTIGANTMIGHHCVIREATKIGAGCRIGHMVVFEGATEMGDHSFIHAQCHISSYSKIGSYVFIGPMLVTTNDPVMSYKRPNIQKKEVVGVIIHDGARIAAGCAIMPGITIGREALVGANSLVTRDVPDYAIVYGSPAKIMGRVPETHLLKNNGVEI